LAAAEHLAFLNCGGAARMTFYNIIFGILFLGACQAAVASIGTDLDGWLLILVAVLIFTDVVNTSEAVENRGVEYTIWMKLYDLLSFLLLGLSIILLSKSTKNFLLDTDVYHLLPEFLKYQIVPPVLLLVYCAVVALWTRDSPKLVTREQWPRSLQYGAGVAVLALIVIGGLRYFGLTGSTPYKLFVLAGIGGAFVYLISFTLIPKAIQESGPLPDIKKAVDAAADSATGAKKYADAAEAAAGLAKKAASEAASAVASVKARAGTAEVTSPAPKI
jgi:hypothetical protein